MIRDVGASSAIVRAGSDGEWDGADILALAIAPAVAASASGPPAERNGDADQAPRPLGRPARRVLGSYGVDLEAVARAERWGARAGEVLRAPVSAPAGLPPRLLLIGTGAGAPGDLRRSAAVLARASRGATLLVTTLGSGAGAEGTRAVVEGLVLGGYAPASAGLRDRAGSAPVRRILLVGDHPEEAVRRGAAHASATVLARGLAETPSNRKTPAWLARRAVESGERAGLTVRTWAAADLAAEGFGGLLAVGGGSASPPCLVRLDYEPPGGSPGRRVVLVGKGITFDSGGLSIKPREAMVPMKTDMSGAAAVLAALAGCAELGVRRRVTGLLPLAENAFGGGSYRPGDVVRVHGGRTVEVANTDAEGRVVLADALGYAVATLDPAVIVDVATLTGAAALGLGRRHAALYATDERLAAGLERAGAQAGERVWRMPLVEDYRRAIDSDIADVRQIPRDPTLGGGSITAALFLREFTGGRSWAHLDIAGPARADADEYEVTKGATGFGARLLLRWLESLR